MEIEFIKKGHIYLIDGVIAPSVSQILNFIDPNKYKNIPKSILQSAADFGTNIHKAIEDYENGLQCDLKPLERVVFEQYIKVKEKHNLTPISHEQLIHYDTKYVGRLDMIADVNYYRCLVDVKTTSKVDTEALEWQLGMYKLAYEDMGLGKLHQCYCLWLPKKNTGKLIEIVPKTKAQIERVLVDYEKSQK